MNAVYSFRSTPLPTHEKDIKIYISAKKMIKLLLKNKKKCYCKNSSFQIIIVLCSIMYLQQFP